MNSMKLTTDFFILLIAVNVTVIRCDACGEDDFKKIQHTHIRGGTKYPGETDAEACKTKCLQEDECKAVDWNFVHSSCWLHFMYDMQLKTDTSVTHYYNCKNGLLPVFTEDPQTAGFPAINRSHVYLIPWGFDPDACPIVILQPLLTSAAAFSEAVVQTVEFYVRSEDGVEVSVAAGIARPNENGFELLTTSTASVDIEGRIDSQKDENPDIISQPGDAIYVLPFALEKYGGPFGIAYDVGTSDVCGVTYSGVLHMSSWTVHSLNILDECWMMSISFDLSPVN